MERMWGNCRLVSLSLQEYYGANPPGSHVHPLCKKLSGNSQDRLAKIKSCLTHLTASCEGLSGLGDQVNVVYVGSSGDGGGNSRLLKAVCMWEVPSCVRSSFFTARVVTGTGDVPGSLHPSRY